MYCPTCGSDNPSAGRFCRRCGTGLEAVSLALSRKAEDPPLEKSQLTQLIKDYYSGRHEMIGGLGGAAAGIVIPAALLVAGWWGFFWIFVWIFMGVFGNGIRQFNNGWNKWSDASSELKAMGYDGVPARAFHSAENKLSQIREARNPQPFRQSETEAPSSVTESTTRNLDFEAKK